MTSEPLAASTLGALAAAGVAEWGAGAGGLRMAEGLGLDFAYILKPVLDLRGPI